MVYITGDTHGDFSRFYKFNKKAHPTKEDVMIILGDAGLNYYGNRLDALRKTEAAVLPMTFFCIHGNHEMRPEHIASYKTKRFHGGTVWYEPDFPNLLFARDGDVYRLGGHDCIVIGGAYSVDKFYRLQNGWQWFEDEQPSEAIKARVENALAKRDYKIDTVLSHTCPIRYEPIEVFLPSIDQSTVDKSTEQWLGSIEQRLDYKAWYCGHYHTAKKIDKLRFMFEDIDVFGV